MSNSHPERGARRSCKVGNAHPAPTCEMRRPWLWPISALFSPRAGRGARRFCRGRQMSHPAPMCEIALPNRLSRQYHSLQMVSITTVMLSSSCALRWRALQMLSSGAVQKALPTAPFRANRLCGSRRGHSALIDGKHYQMLSSGLAATLA